MIKEYEEVVQEIGKTFRLLDLSQNEDIHGRWRADFRDEKYYPTVISLETQLNIGMKEMVNLCPNLSVEKKKEYLGLLEKIEVEEYRERRKI